ncbi:EscU/YscU/HrcU family type III secretion system export apparatus switch protein [Metabacillus herbersteinensis]|uniref:EscU/YscU/HrcU family type III secretion system export apparatus switch protein n=1 Tax=Metabacillus herbersteinensis TaxID=283816 RepID=A0ABV6GC77_9BACI
MKKETKRNQAIALKYTNDLDQAPKVIAKGKGLIAENIIEAAKKNNVAIQEDASLIEVLSKLDIHQQIPEELYEAVAEIFAFVYRIDRDMK